MKNEAIKIKVDIGKNAMVNSSSIGNITIYDSDPIMRSYAETKADLVTEIEEMARTDRRYVQLFSIIKDLDQYIDKNFDKFKSNIKQVCCNLKGEVTGAQIRTFLLFIVSIILKEEHEKVDLDSLYGDERKRWLAIPHGSDNIKIERALTKVLYYLTMLGDKCMKDGECFIAKLKIADNIDCSKCRTGELKIKIDDMSILSDFIEDIKPIVINNTQLQQDYMQIKSKSNLVFKCGNCLTDLEELYEAKEKAILGSVKYE